MTAFYNEIDPYAAQWLRNLIAAEHIAHGVVDERSIEDIEPAELDGYTQCHFFAGIGVWSLALRNAGWSDDRPVWTGSCPCQPFSSAGKGAGFDDERHLWPAFHHLIEQCRPPVVIGEQVASKDADTWIDLVQTDMEALGYAFGAIPFPASGVGAPHIRDRLYWLADSDSHRCEAGHGIQLHGSEHDAQYGSGSNDEQPRPTNGHWRDADWLICRDGKWRPVESGTFPLAHGAASRVGRLRAYGNAINAVQAQIFVECYMEGQSC